MAYHSKTTFTFGPEFGARLRELRKRRGLTLRAMALLMDRQGSGAHTQLGRLEQGKVKYPSINLVADYLRACGAGFEDLLDLLKQHTSQPPVLKEKGDAAVAELLKSLPMAEQRAMLKWEKATVEAREAKAVAVPDTKKPKVETDRQRVFRVVWSFIHANWNEVFEQKLYEAMLKLKDEVPRSRRKDACGHARRFFGILTRYYRNEKRRQGALERVERRAKEDGFSDQTLAALVQAATDAHFELEKSGRLDWQPSQEAIVESRGRAPKVERAETRLEMDEVRPLEASNKMLGVIAAVAQEAVDASLRQVKLEYYHGREYYYRWINELIQVAYEHGTDSPEWKANVDERAPRLHDEKVAREAAAMIADIFNRWKVNLPPKPTGA